MTREEKKYFAKLEKASKNNPMVRVEAAADFINRFLTQAFTTPRGINGDGLCYLLSALTGVAVADISKKMSLADMLNGSFSSQMELDTEAGKFIVGDTINKYLYNSPMSAINIVEFMYSQKNGKDNLPDLENMIKEIKQELTYNELDKSIENLWSILFTTGYLTQRERIDSRKLRLAIPNREIKELFELQIREWFQEKSSEDVKKLDKLCMAFPDGDAETIEDLFNDYLWNTISIRDTAVKGRKENFYHGVLLGLLSHMENWAVWSNIESGEGYCDILLEVPENRVGVVIEMKYAQEDRMEAACTEALKQIEQRQYAARLKSDGMKNIVNYGIACYRKHCKVKIGKENS